MCRLVLMTVAVLAILFGISGLYMMPKLVQQKIEQRIQLKIGTKAFDRFTRVPIPLTVKFYFFNITNSEQVLAGLERPRFQEVGPFMFKQWRRREIVDILDHNRKISYREIKTFYPMYPQALLNSSEFVYYEPETNKIITNEEYEARSAAVAAAAAAPPNNVSHSQQTTRLDSNASLIKMLNPYAHNITVVNLPLLSVLTQLAHLDEGSIKRSLAAKIASRLIESGQEKILITRGANQFLFDGYKVGLMDAATDLISNTLGYNFESPLPRNKFGFFHTKNATWSRREAGEVTIYTGRNNSMDQFMLVDTWNGMRTLNVWPRTSEAGNRCNEVRGTDGSQFHPGVTRQQVLHIFSPMICTSIYIKYKEDTSVRDIPLLRFTTPPEVFAAPKKHAQNSCYCAVRQQHQTTAQANEHIAPFGTSAQTNINKPPRAIKITNSRCYIDGLMDLGPCQRGAPIAASSPHFYNSDPMLAMAAGLEPRRDKHETLLDIEPMTGAVMRAASRAQLNAMVEEAALDVVDSRLIGQMAPMVAPLLWLEESAQIDEKSSIEFKNQLLNTVQRAKRSFVYAIVIGALVGLAVAAQYWYVTCYKMGPISKRQPDLEHSLETTAKRRARRRKEQELHRATGARRANLAGRQPLLKPGGDNLAPKSSSVAGVAAQALGVAAVLGAADAAATANNRRARVAERRRTRRADYEQENDDGHTLVGNEWPMPAKSGHTSTAGSSSTPTSTMGAVDDPSLITVSSGPSELGGAQLDRESD